MSDTIFATLFIFICGVFAGITLVGAGLWYILSFFFYDRDAKGEKEKPNQQSTSATFQLPPVLLAKISDESYKSKESCWALNFILYFLFRELRNSDGVRRWVLRKLSLEFDELLASSVLGKFFSSIMIQNIDIGQNFPVVNWLRTSRIELHPVFKSISTLEILVDLVYSGGFQFSIQAETHLKHTASLSVQINAVKGQAQLKFCAEPYAHWSFSFSENPDIDISVVSQLYGKSFSQITAIIAAQLKRSVRKKHTLPMYKIRYKPFFNRFQHFVASLEPGSAPRIDTTGTLTVTLVECRSLMHNLIHGSIYANIAIGDFDWIAAYSGSSSTSVYIVRDVVCVKTAKRESNLDFTLSQHGDTPIVESVNPNISSISQAIFATIRVCGTFSNSELELEPGDEIIAVDGKKVTTVKQCIKNFRNSSSMKVVWRIRRIYSTGIKSERGAKVTNQDIKSGEDCSEECVDAQICVNSRTDAITMPRKENEPPSPTPSRKSSANTATESVSELMDSDFDNIVKQSALNFRMSSGDNRIQYVLRTKDIPCCKDPIFVEPFDLTIQEPHRFVNFTLWSARQSSAESSTSSSPSHTPVKRSKRCQVGAESLTFGHDIVLGYLSIPLADIVSDCLTTGMGYFTKDFYLCSSDGIAADAKEHPLKDHSGFEPEMCYGVVTLSFLFKSSEAISHRKVSVDSVAGSTIGIGGDAGAEAPSEHNNSPNEDLHSHQFFRTHFRSAAICDYCNKKIWLKDAYTCRACGMKCHKKCNERCMVNTVCRGEIQNQPSQFTTGHAAPEIITTDSEPIQEIEDNQTQSGCHESGSKDKTLQPTSNTMNVRRKTLGGLIVSAVQSRSSHLKRAGSATTLLAPTPSPTNFASKSLPPSPQISPTLGRKGAAMSVSGSENNISSLGNPFQIIEAEALGSAEESFQLNAAVEHLIKHPNDDLVSLAKETGRDVFDVFSLTDRKAKLNYVLNRLQSEIDSVTNERMAYEKEDSSTSASKSSTTLRIGQCEEKVQALALLMLHYCAGLQHVQELEDNGHGHEEENMDNLVQFSYDDENCQDDKISDTGSQGSNEQ